MKYIIDRFEGNLAVCEDEHGNMVNFNRNKLPMDAKECDVICITNAGVEIDIDATNKRKSKIQELVKELWID